MFLDKEQTKEYRDSLSRFFDLFQVGRTQSDKVTLLESFYVVYEKLGVNKPITPEVYKKILNDQRYISHARQGTVKMKNMNGRWKAVYEIWTGKDEPNY